MISCSSDNGISDDTGENTILTDKTAKYHAYDFQTDESGTFKSNGYGFDMEKFEPIEHDEIAKMKDLNGDGLIIGNIKYVIDKFQDVKEHILSIDANTEHQIPWNARLSNKYYTFTFGKSKGRFIKKSCELNLNKGDKVKTDRNDIQFKKQDLRKTINNGELQISENTFYLRSEKIRSSAKLTNYKYLASFHEPYFDLRGVKKNWIEENTEFSYKIEGSSILIEGKEYTFSGTIDQERRQMRLKQTYPSSSDIMYFDIEF